MFSVLIPTINDIKSGKVYYSCIAIIILNYLFYRSCFSVVIMKNLLRLHVESVVSIPHVLG